VPTNRAKLLAELFLWAMSWEFHGVIKSVRDRAIFTVMYWRGLRRSEVGTLQLSAWRQQAGRIYMKRKKGSESGEYPLSPAEQRALKAWIRTRGQAPGPLFTSRNGHGISGVMLDVLMKQYGELAKLPKDLRHCHALKHSIGTHLIGSGAELFAVKDWLGHKDIKSTMEYVRFRSKQRDKVANEIYDQQ
jgi:site-specific recombinase XerC